jgi:hypothetical protein
MRRTDPVFPRQAQVNAFYLKSKMSQMRVPSGWFDIGLLTYVSIAIPVVTAAIRVHSSSSRRRSAALSHIATRIAAR